jgi:hypothetical protein
LTTVFVAASHPQAYDFFFVCFLAQKIHLNTLPTTILYMTVYNKKTEFGKENRKNEAEEQTEEKKGRFRKFCKNLWDATKRTTQILGVAVGMTVVAYGCGGKIQHTSDADVEEVVDGEDGEDIVEPEDIIEDDIVDEEVVTNCTETSEPLEGEVDPLLANSENEGATLNSTDTEVFGDAEMTVGGVVGTDEVLMLGQCPNDPNAVAAFGAQSSDVSVAGQYRIDLGNGTFHAEFPDVDADLCPPPVTDDVPVSMYLDETNLSVKEASIGGIDSMAEFSFVTPLSPVILVNGSESSSPIALDGSGYEVKAVMISLDSPLLEMAATVYSNTGEEVLTREVEGSAPGVDSKTLKVYQLGSGERILPTVDWTVPSVSRLCLRSDTGDPKEVDLEISGEVIAAAMDSCGKIFGSFDVNIVSATIVSIEPPHLSANYSVASSNGSGLDAMEEGDASITITMRRERVAADFGESVMMHVAVEGSVVSTEANPVTGVSDNVTISLPLITVVDPDVLEYSTECGYYPGGIS